MKKKSNRGQISVYACVMTATFLALILVVLLGIRTWEAKAKCYQAVDASIDSLKGDYQPDLFRRYHLLAVDQTYYGKGQGYMEERLEEYLEQNLNSEQSLYIFNIEDVVITDTKSLTEDSLSGMKQQIQEYMVQKFPIDVADILFGDLQQIDTTDNELEEVWKQTADLSDNDYSKDMMAAPTEENLEAIGILEDIKEFGLGDDESVSVEKLIALNREKKFLNDPRKALDTIQQAGILYLVMPDRVSTVSNENVNLQNVPSAKYDQDNSVWQIPDFSEITNIKELSGLLSSNSEIQTFNSSNYALQELYGIAYTMDAFQSVQNVFYQEDEEYHVFDYEVEYILEGKSSDYENLTAVANQLLLLRLVPNLSYAFTNEKMKSETTLAATVLLTPIYMEAFIEPVSYVFLACWAYGESLMDVKCLFQGDRVPLVKDEDTWQLSLNGIAKLATEQPKECKSDKGLNYSEYIAFLLAVMPDADMKYYRMLDIMELNIQEDIPEFEIENCIYGFQVQVELQEQGNSWCINGDGGYLK